MHYLWESPAVIRHTQCLLNSYRHWLNHDLLPLSPNPAAAHQLFNAAFVVLSHGTEVDPILNYGNQAALTLWEMKWPDFTTMPSRLTAEPDLWKVRSQLLAAVAQQGYLTGYEGIRISKTGQRFLIQNATIWKVLDEAGNICGQAATFAHWQKILS